MVQVPGVSHQLCKFLDILWIREVFTLGCLGHHQVVADQPCNHFPLRRLDIEHRAKSIGIDGTQLGMVTAASLGNVVKNRGQVEQLRLGNSLEYLAGVRK